MNYLTATENSSLSYFLISQIGVKYGGEDIPGSPFGMTSNADTSDVIGDGSRKNSGRIFYFKIN